jgi:hypothetical protein
LIAIHTEDGYMLPQETAERPHAPHPTGPGVAGHEPVKVMFVASVDQLRQTASAGGARQTRDGAADAASKERAAARSAGPRGGIRAGLPAGSPPLGVALRVTNNGVDFSDPPLSFAYARPPAPAALAPAAAPPGGRVVLTGADFIATPWLACRFGTAAGLAPATVLNASAVTCEVPGGWPAPGPPAPPH